MSLKIRSLAVNAWYLFNERMGRERSLIEASVLFAVHDAPQRFLSHLSLSEGFIPLITALIVYDDATQLVVAAIRNASHVQARQLSVCVKSVCTRYTLMKKKKTKKNETLAESHDTHRMIGKKYHLSKPFPTGRLISF